MKIEKKISMPADHPALVGPSQVQAKTHHYSGDVTELVDPEADFESCLTKRFSIHDTMQEQAGGSGNLFGAVH